MPFDDSVENSGTGGTETRRTTNHAHLQIGDLNWNDKWAMYVEKQLGDDADGTIGYDVFEDKVVEALKQMFPDSYRPDPVLVSAF